MTPECRVQVEELVQRKREAPKYLRQQARREWREIHDGTLRFDRVEEEVAALQALSHKQLLAFFQVQPPIHLEPKPCQASGIMQQASETPLE